MYPDGGLRFVRIPVSATLGVRLPASYRMARVRLGSVRIGILNSVSFLLAKVRLLLVMLCCINLGWVGLVSF
jgi:hypothetical protein